MKAAPFKFISMALLLLGLAACASGPQRNPEDPLEPFNRSMFAFNEGLDKAVAKPAAQGYQTIAPYPVRMHISNFFNNLQDGWTVVNNALQLRPQAFAESFFRFSFKNSHFTSLSNSLASRHTLEVIFKTFFTSMRF